MHFNRLELLLDSLVINAYPTGSANALQNLKGSRAARKYFPDDLYFRPRETSIGAIPRSRRASCESVQAVSGFVLLDVPARER